MSMQPIQHSLWKVRNEIITVLNIITNLAIKCSSGYCVSRDSFCDGVNDCPGGEDEHHCYGIHYKSTVARESNDYGEVMQQTFGLWHSKCYNRSQPITPDEMLQLCQVMGYKNQPRVDYRIVDKEMASDRPKAMKPILNSAYSNLMLNKNFNVLIKPSQRVAKLVEWEKTDEENCNRLEIRCEGVE